MTAAISPRIAQFVDRLPLVPGLRVLEIGCGPGVAAREVARRVAGGFVLAIDRSQKAIAQAEKGSAEEIGRGALAFRCVAAEDFQLLAGEEPFDLAFAMRVGAFDGRHPDAGEKALSRLRLALKPGGLLYVDSPAPMHAIEV